MAFVYYFSSPPRSGHVQPDEGTSATAQACTCVLPTALPPPCGCPCRSSIARSMRRAVKGTPRLAVYHLPHELIPKQAWTLHNPHHLPLSPPLTPLDVLDAPCVANLIARLAWHCARTPSPSPRPSSPRPPSPPLPPHPPPTAGTPPRPRRRCLVEARPRRSRADAPARPH